MSISSLSVRNLADRDLEAVNGFLADHADSSMFMLNNARNQGLEYSGRRGSADYWGAFGPDGALCGVLAHCWNGNILLQAPEAPALASLIDTLGSEVTRPIAGALGDEDQVQAVMDLVGATAADCALHAREDLYALGLDDLRRPPRPGEADRLTVILAREAGRELLSVWIRDFEIEALGRTPGQALDRIVADRVDAFMRSESLWVLTDGGVPVSLSGFNAALPGRVQIGPVWTPPEHRSRGYARYLLADSLAAARVSGVRRAILFTQSPAGAKAYEAVGFRRIGIYRVALLRDPVSLR
ncbi:MAG: GNAT family N-acetyltransferase [Alphaproteobacteria bacterium]|nr:GNAT family N-acetyltransferase [Alphaproteobacteria bacterium]